MIFFGSGFSERKKRRVLVGQIRRDGTSFFMILLNGLPNGAFCYILRENFEIVSRTVCLCLSF